MLYLYSINCKLLAKVKCQISKVNCLLFSNDGKYIICAGEGSYIVIRSLDKLNIVHIFDSNSTITSCSFVVHDNYLFAASSTGQMEAYLFQPSLW